MASTENELGMSENAEGFPRDPSELTLCGRNCVCRRNDQIRRLRQVSEIFEYLRRVDAFAQDRRPRFLFSGKSVVPAVEGNELAISPVSARVGDLRLNSGRLEACSGACRVV